MTFEKWWKENGIEQATYAEKSAARKGWEAGTKVEREACLAAIEAADNCECGVPCYCFTAGAAWRAIRARSNAM